ncbi:potassium channel family protein [Rubellimicrobium arenae]|uniref:potassium channel family protein n=1 Tax=Rubellimicrobium arenae TaxID=2817372 RepID=UPI001B308C71|nr:potassium channel family protein [Rubellimicrobium arenae]
MIAAMAASVVLVVATVLIFYEALRLTSSHLADLPVPPRARILAVVLASFAAHTVAVWTYAAAYWLLAVVLNVPSFAGVPVSGLLDCLYFSVVTYTSLGFGDHVPVGHARLIAGVEALNGLLLIGWSASFTYLVMERYWPMHDPEGNETQRPPRAARFPRHEPRVEAGAEEPRSALEMAAAQSGTSQEPDPAH